MPLPTTNAGDYTAAAGFGGDANHNGSTDSEDFQIAKVNRTITFGALAVQTYGDAPFKAFLNSDEYRKRIGR